MAKPFLRNYFCPGLKILMCYFLKVQEIIIPSLYGSMSTQTN
jgi:hypothetical protein